MLKFLAELVCMAALTSAPSIYAGTAPSVLAIAPPDTNKTGTSGRLLSFTQGGRKEIAEFSGQTYYGNDENVAAFLELNGIRKPGLHLLVVDRQSSAVLADKSFPGPDGFFPSLTKSTIADRLAVRSEDSSVYFDTLNSNGFGIGEINWKTEKVRQLPFTPPVARMSELFLFSYPPALVVTGFTGTTSILYNVHAGMEVLRRPAMQDGRTWEWPRHYFIPAIGLMEYDHGIHLQLTDSNLSTWVPNPLRFPGAIPIGRIQTSVMDGKPSLIWGENPEPVAHPREQNYITEIVIFDPVLKKEVLRKPLGPGISKVFQANPAGTRIYFYKPETGEIFYLDRQSQSVVPLAQTGFYHLDGRGFEVMLGN
jgi:hypothetical protein